MAIIDNFSKEELTKIVQESSSYSEVISKLGYKTCTGKNNETLKRRLNQFNISVEHFKLRTIPVVRTVENVFCENSTANQSTLRRWYLRGQYTEYKCDICGIKEWQGQPLVLQLDHKNGHNKDNRLENLHWLCPNCHSQTLTFAGKQSNRTHLTLDGLTDKVKEHYCIDCGKPICAGATRCADCYNKSRRTVNWPSRNELKEMIRTIPFTDISKKYDVSDNTIRKWCDFYHLPRKKSEIKKYSDEEWGQI